MKQLYLLTRESADTRYEPMFVAWYGKAPTAKTLRETILRDTGNDDSDDTVAGLLEGGRGAFGPDTTYVLRDFNVA